MSRIAEIVALMRLADGTLGPDALAQTVRRRWPDLDEATFRAAKARAASFGPESADERIASTAALSAILGFGRAPAPVFKRAERPRKLQKA